ncbi:DUF3667 domain-containing protein [Flavobacterium sp.]|uniref:DUF3667 domain-containing protein n=1 Tax=Flavobacterium sp. TaxID=239 RepID=UPI0026051945|nr:DUF3667 domain-containing protein [Flavobacterium sp.]
MNATLCPNCNDEIIKNFCSNCGQKKFKRIDKKYIWDEIQYTTIHTNKGLLYTLKNLVVNPGKTARQFIDGCRVNHYKPILLVFLLSGISTFISIKFLNFSEILKKQYESQQMSAEFANEIVHFIASYNSLIMLALVPIFASFTKIGFFKWGHNYYEHIVINAYFLSFYIVLIMIFVYPIMYFVKDNPVLYGQMSQYFMLLVPILLFWFFCGFYPERSKKSVFWSVLLTLIVTVIGFGIVMTLAVIVGVVMAMAAGPEALEMFKPKTVK